MDKRKTVIRFFTIADYMEEEQWLEEMHQSGWKLVRMIPPCFFVFEECSTEKGIYKLDYKNRTVTGDYIQMYRDYGWEYLGSCFGWNYFRKPDAEFADENEKEIFSDNESKVRMIQHIFKTRMLPLMVVFCLIIVPNLIRFSSDVNDAWDLGLVILYLVLFLVYLYIFIHCGLKLVRLKKDLER